MLLEAGSEAMLNTALGDQGAPIHLATASARLNIVAMLLDAGVIPDANGSIFSDALQIAAAFGHEDIIRLLLAKGAKPNRLHGAMGSAYLAAAAGTCEKHVQIAAVFKPLSLNQPMMGFFGEMRAFSRLRDR
jgi:hypothetical protein